MSTTIMQAAASMVSEVAASKADRVPPSHAPAVALPPHAIGKRIYSDGMSSSFRQGFISWLLAVVTLGVYVGWVYVGYVWIIAATFNSYAAAALLGTMLTVLLPGRHWPEFLEFPVFRMWREYFNFSFVFDEALDFANKNYVFAEYPHAVFPMSQFLAATMEKQAWPGHHIYNIAADVLFRIPLWRHVMLWIGSQPATAQNFKRLLKMGSVAVVAGGIAEQYMQHPKQEQILLRKRKGFVRVAVENGCDIVPVYHFGNTLLLTAGPKWLQPYARKLRMSLGYMYGRWCLPLPRQVPLLMVCGRSVGVNKYAPDHPDFAAEVDRVHAAVIEEIQRVYDTWKGEYGWADKPLVIF